MSSPSTPLVPPPNPPLSPSSAGTAPLLPPSLPPTSPSSPASATPAIYRPGSSSSKEQDDSDCSSPSPASSSDNDDDEEEGGGDSLPSHSEDEGEGEEGGFDMLSSHEFAPPPSDVSAASSKGEGDDAEGKMRLSFPDPLSEAGGASVDETGRKEESGEGDLGSSVISLLSSEGEEGARDAGKVGKGSDHAEGDEGEYSMLLDAPVPTDMRSIEVEADRKVEANEAASADRKESPSPPCSPSSPRPVVASFARTSTTSIPPFGSASTILSASASHSTVRDWVRSTSSATLSIPSPAPSPSLSPSSASGTECRDAETSVLLETAGSSVATVVPPRGNGPVGVGGSREEEATKPGSNEDGTGEAGERGEEEVEKKQVGEGEVGRQVQAADKMEKKSVIAALPGAPPAPPPARSARSLLPYFTLAVALSAAIVWHVGAPSLDLTTRLFERLGAAPTLSSPSPAANTASEITLSVTPSLAADSSMTNDLATAAATSINSRLASDAHTSDLPSSDLPTASTAVPVRALGDVAKVASEVEVEVEAVSEPQSPASGEGAEAFEPEEPGTDGSPQKTKETVEKKLIRHPPRPIDHAFLARRFPGLEIEVKKCGRVRGGPSSPLEGSFAWPVLFGGGGVNVDSHPPSDRRRSPNHRQTVFSLPAPLPPTPPYSLLTLPALSSFADLPYLTDLRTTLSTLADSAASHTSSRLARRAKTLLDQLAAIDLRLPSLPSLQSAMSSSSLTLTTAAILKKNQKKATKRALNAAEKLSKALRDETARLRLRLRSRRLGDGIGSQVQSHLVGVQARLGRLVADLEALLDPPSSLVKHVAQQSSTKADKHLRRATRAAGWLRRVGVVKGWEEARERWVVKQGRRRARRERRVEGKRDRKGE